MSVPQELRPRKSPAQSRSQRMVDDLLDATARVLIRDGWSKASTNRIARAAGVSIGSIYQYFPNKDALVMAVARRHGDQMIALLSRTLSGIGEAGIEQAVPQFVRGMIEAHRLDPDLHLALIHQVLHVKLESIEETQTLAWGLVRSYLEAHRSELVVGDLDAATWMCVTTVEAVVHAAVLDRTRDRLNDPAVERELCAMLLRYLAG